MTLKERREAAGLTTAQVAKKLDVTASAVYNWEYGYNGIIRKYQKRLARLYGCTVDELMEDFGKEGEKNVTDNPANSQHP